MGWTKRTQQFLSSANNHRCVRHFCKTFSETSSEMLRRVVIVRTDVSEDHSSFIIRVTRIGELGTLAVSRNRRTLRRNNYILCVRRLLVTANVPSSPILVTLIMEAPRTSETSVLTKSTRRNIPQDGILHSQRRENLKSYIFSEIFNKD
jgi:hypothetical protein